jgi:hypothetical protein
VPAGSGRAAGAGGGLATLDEYLAGQDAAAMAGRTPVLAVGSNRSPAQLARKLREPSRPALGLVPIIRARVNGIGVGFSAHVGRWGYVPAAPVRRPGWQDQWLTWLDPVQLELVNATEINYRLVFAPYELQLAGCPSAAVPGWVFYRSRWGVLATAPGAIEPAPPSDQAAIYRRLLSWPWFCAPAADRADVPAVIALLRDREDLRQQARDQFAARGLAIDDGLGPDIPAAPG